MQVKSGMAAEYLTRKEFERDNRKFFMDTTLSVWNIEIIFWHMLEVACFRALFSINHL